MTLRDTDGRISRHIRETPYLHRDGGVVHDETIADTWRRAARAVASVEREDA